MKKVVMLVALFLGTTFMMNANNTIPAKTGTAKEVKANVSRKHKKTKKAKQTTETAKPAANTQK